MIEKRTIENVNPLIGFRLDCYRHALLPAIKHFSGDIRPFLLAKSGEFLFSEHLEFKETSLINYNKVLSFIGIDRQTIKINDDIIEIICDNISRDKIVLAFIDTYKYSRFPSSYLKFHSRHDLPIFGFDKNNKVFDIIDSDYIEGFSRRKATISFDEFIIARIELLEHYKIKLAPKNQTIITWTSLRILINNIINQF